MKEELKWRLEPFFLTSESSPRTVSLYKKFPHETKVFWYNIQNDRLLNEGINTELEDFLQPALVDKAKECFLADGLAVLDVTRASGLRPLKGYLRTETDIFKGL